MPRLVRFVAPVLAAVAIALAGGTSVLAASGSAADVQRQDLHTSWCFDDSPAFLYCFDMEGTAHYVDNTAGSAVTVNERLHTVVYMDGVKVAEVSEVSLLRSTYQADGTMATQEVSHTKSAYGDRTCRITIVWRQVDFEPVVDHWSGGCD
jgi:hypothetical protein